MRIQAPYEKLILVLFFVVSFGVLLRVGTTPAPIYASDEYAYLKCGLDLGKTSAIAQSARDPGLQGLSNHVYFWVVQLASRVSGDPTTVIRLLNFVCYFVLLPLLGGSLLRRHSGLGAHVWFVGLLALLPASVFVLSPMPEVLFATVYTGIAVMTVRLIRPAPSVAGLLAGVTLGFLVYIKPHAVAAMVSFALFFLLHSIRNWSKREWSRRLLSITFVAGLALGIFFVNVIVLGQPSFAPKFVGNVYVGAVQSAFSVSHFREAVEGVAGYALIHGLVLILLFPLALAGSIQAIVRLTHRREKIAWDVFDDLGLLTVISAAAFIAMTAHFSHYASVGAGFEANRLHGRYLMVIFPSLLIITCHVLSVLVGKTDTRLSVCVRNRWFIGGFALVAMGTIWFLTHSKLFPWDYPELFGLYSQTNNYWDWKGPIGLRIPVLAAGLSILLACLILPRYTPRLLVLGQTMIFSASLFLVTFWQETQARIYKPLAAAGRILRLETGSNAEDLLLVGDSRYGDVSYALCGLLGDPWVTILNQDSDLTASMIPSGVKTVATLGSYNVKFPFASYSERGPLRTYGLDASMIRTYSVPPSPWDGKEFVVHTGSNAPNAALFGFNPPEPWGAWTADDDAIILLPYRIQGSVCLRFRSWVAKESGPVALTLGDATLTFQPNPTPVEFYLPVLLNSPADRIRIHFPGARGGPWEPRVGVAVSEIAICPEP
jgi:branched-subunit amino acid transport protein